MNNHLKQPILLLLILAVLHEQKLNRNHVLVSSFSHVVVHSNTFSSVKRSIEALSSPLLHVHQSRLENSSFTRRYRRLNSSHGSFFATTTKDTFQKVKDKSDHDTNSYASDERITINDCQIFKGKNKWLGGAIDSKDGSIYGIPSNSHDIICLRPTTREGSIEYQVHKIPLPKGVRMGKFKWLRGIITGGCLYGIPAWSNDGVLKLDLQKLWNKYEEKKRSGFSHEENPYDADAVSIIPLPDSFYDTYEENKPSRWLWHGAALNSNHTAIYCIPSNAHQVLKVNLEQAECSFLPIPQTAPASTPLLQTNKWYGGILGNDNAIYGIPYSAANVLRIDADTDRVSLLGNYGLNEYNWHGGIKSDVNGCIYCFPAHHSHILKIDTNCNDVSPNSQCSRLTLLPIQRASYDKDKVTRYKWLGGSLGADGNIYGMPSDASRILR